MLKLIFLSLSSLFPFQVFGDPKVLRSYYYAITDFTVGGRCQCNGHATHCISSQVGGRRKNAFPAKKVNKLTF